MTAARHVGIGIYPVSTLSAKPEAVTLFRPAGFILGFTSLTVEQIQQGIETLGALLATWSVGL